MSPLTIASTLFSLAKSIGIGSSSQSNNTETVRSGTRTSEDFSSSLELRMAALQAQSVNSLLGSVFNGGQASSSLDFLTGANKKASGASEPLSLLGFSTSARGLSPGGRNLSLFNPESAYRMMSVINNKDVTYKAQFSELSEMKTNVNIMQQAGQALGKVSESMDNEAIKSELQAFAGQYNEWIKRFDGTVKNDGLLAGTQAAEISLYELEQSVENIFNGAKNGFHGLRDLGLSIDQTTNLATLDTSKLDTALASNKDGAVSTIHEFSANFAKSAGLLTSANNFIPNRLANLDRAIDYITDNKPALQAEFGLGDPARPSTPIAKALAAYNQIFRI
ncbi:MAG: flagellar filament capping protein FliD [Propionivibrio sp.]|uniref:flagellar filament capping protein FliD n=1 Tax=Propionivibrio sp. TaxID=2212460 RepID=UPI001A554925|nr:flagellar filament capping protein FliD [Propionivibrio sp.]MBL8415683.1 flagellar filament capping protein FliD [Propionivibrio sp.]